MTDPDSTDTAGTGPPVPAVPSPPPVRGRRSSPGQAPDAGRAPVDVVPPEARVELERIRRRWAELTLERAQSRMPLLRRVLADLGPRSAATSSDVPDLGPAVVADQLAVLVWDAYAQGRGDGIPALLASTRRALG